MKHLSMTNTLVDAQRSLRRFPLVLFCALIAAITAVYLTDGSHSDGPAQRYLLTSVLGIPLFLTLALALERKPSRPWMSWLTWVVGLSCLGLYFLTLPRELPTGHYIRFSILLAGGHFLVAVAPFLRGKSGNALWQFNKNILLRLISSVLFTLVMFAGLSLALAAMDQLLGLPLPDEIYWKLFLILGFIFHTWFFLGGIPENPMNPADEEDFPRPLRVFAQHILSTLVVVYLAIMMAYLGKVIITGVWPSGWIGWLVSGVAVTGLLSVVLLSPLQGKPDSPWIGIYFRIFHILMVPSVVMLVLAVSKRINQYGLTEPRYLLLILSAWVMMILVAGLVARRINLRLIPLSLGILALIISIGPWGAVPMSLHSQMGRLEDKLMAVGLFSNGKLAPSQTGSTTVDRSDLRNSFHHLFGRYGHSKLDSWFTPKMHHALNRVMSDNKSRPRDNWSRANLIMDELNLPLEKASEGHIVTHLLDGESRFFAIPVKGFHHSLDLKTFAGNKTGFQWDDVRGEVGLSELGDKMIIRKDHRLLMEMPLAEILLDLSNSGREGHLRTRNVLQDMTIDFANENLKIRLIIYSVDFQHDSQLPMVTKMSGLLLLGDTTNLEPGPQ